VIRYLLAVLLFIPTLVLADDEAILKLNVADKQYIFTYSELLQSSYVQKNVKLEQDIVYKKHSPSYTAIRLCDLLKPFNVAMDSEIKFTSIDSFSVYIPARLLLSCQETDSIAWLAIEEAKHHPWPLLPEAGDKSAGPFMLIWQKQQLSHITQEYWPWQLSLLTVIVKGSLDEFAAIYPQNNAKLQNGFKVYVKSCAACHTINHIGSSQIGPDLNLPMNPTQYLAPGMLRQLIRDPHSVRTWPKAIMPGFDEYNISDTDLTDLIDYLQSLRPEQKTS
jgi:mono/diheme cytochrome c family protein